MRWRNASEVTEESLADLVTNGVSEDRHLEYKEELPGGTDSDKREFLADVSSFANGAGGYLLYGVREARNDGDARGACAGEIVGVPGGVDSTLLRLENLIRDGVTPRIPGIAIRAVAGAQRGAVIVIQVPRSWNAPHMVSLGGGQRFFVRAGHGKHAMDVHEIRHALLSNKTALAAAREFRTERIGRLMAGESPVRLRAGTARWVIHLLPTMPDISLNLESLEHRWHEIAPLPNRPLGLTDRWNLDGHLSFASNDAGAYWYAQILHRGALEIVEATSAPDELYAVALERLLFHYAQRSMKTAELLDMAGPWFLTATLVGARGHRLRVGSQYYDIGAEMRPESRMFDRDPLILPEVEIGRDGRSFDESLRPICDALWQSSGLPRSTSFDATGSWKPTQHLSK